MNSYERGTPGAPIAVGEKRHGMHVYEGSYLPMKVPIIWYKIDIFS